MFSLPMTCSQDKIDRTYPPTFRAVQIVHASGESGNKTRNLIKYIGVSRFANEKFLWGYY